jgi:hypothetical protein
MLTILLHGIIPIGATGITLIYCHVSYTQSFMGFAPTDTLDL